MRIIASQNDSAGPRYIAADLSHDEFLNTLKAIGLDVGRGLILENVRFHKDAVTIELGRPQANTEVKQ